MRNAAGASEKIGEKIIQVIPDMVFVFDRSLRVLKIYNANEKELLVPASEMVGKNVEAYLPERFVSLIKDGIRKVSEKDGVYEVEYEIETPMGESYYEGRFINIKKDEFACFVRNITERKKNELLLKQNQDLLSSILDNIPFPVMLKDVDDDFRYIYWNKECELQGGFKRDEILGKTDIDIYGEERGKYYQAIGQEIADLKKPYRGQEIFTTPDGKEHTSLVYKNILYNDFHRWMLVTRWDITDLALAEKSLKEANRINRLILDNTNIGFVFLSPDYTVQWENLSIYSSHPIARGYETGILCYKNVRGIDQPCPGCVVEKAIESGMVEQKTVTFNDGTIVEIIATPVYDDCKELQGVVLRVEDITVKKRIAQELERAKEDAEKSDRLKSAFLANMSHEIRTPLNAILGFSELLSQSDNDSERDTYMEIIKRNSDLLLQLINDILDISKIEANTLEFTYSDVDINLILKELEKSFQFKIAENTDLQIDFEPGLPHCVIHTEKNRFLQVISNFITNALKFTDRGRISFGYRPCEEGLYFYVKDTGTGIPKDKQEQIFDRFIKLDSFKTGTGLGLSICQMIIRKLGGKIGVNSEEGKGSEFWCILPCQPIEDQYVEESKDSIVEEKVDTLSEKRIDEEPTLLIAEDVIDNYKLYKVFLEKKYNLIHAWNGREAVELFRLHRPHAILMDIKMPEMDGYEATAIIRKENAEIPIVAVTAFAYAEDKKRIFESGFTSYLTKPITSASLTEALKILKS